MKDMNRTDLSNHSTPTHSIEIPMHKHNMTQTGGRNAAPTAPISATTPDIADSDGTGVFGGQGAIIRPLKLSDSWLSSSHPMHITNDGRPPAQPALPAPTTGPAAVAPVGPASSTACSSGPNKPQVAPETISPLTTRENMRGKPVLYRDVKTVLTIGSEQFQEKLLCDGLVLNLGDACVFNCAFCYVPAAMTKLDKCIIDAHNRETGQQLSFSDVVIRRRHALEVLKAQLVNADGSPVYSDPNDNRVVFSSTLVDVAANMELLRETAAACLLILMYTHWHIRLLSKSPLLKLLIQNEMIPKEYHHRLILGFSIGTLDDKVAAAIELNTGRVSERIKALHWLQDQGIRWEWGDDPDLMVWDAFNNALVRDGLRWSNLDLRYAVIGDYPDVFTQVGIVDVVGPIPNDCLAFVSNFPADLKDQIVNALVAEIATPEGLAIWNNKKFYQWSGMAPVQDSDFDLMRAVLGYPVPQR